MADQARSAPGSISLNSGGQIPVLGFGTWQLTGTRGYQAVRHALEVGYRHIDTATGYHNEDEVGRAIRESGVRREDIFVTTKLPPDNAGRAQQTIDESLRKLGTDYVDLWLIHWPPSGHASVPTWRELLAVHESGQAKAVGVSNYSTSQLDELIDATGVAPAVNQIPWSPRLHDDKRLRHARERSVVIEGYSPFKRSNLSDPVLAAIASAHSVTTAQVVLRWHVEHEIVVIPKSATPERISSNFEISGFSLDADEVARIDALAG
jgi:diketogulonate reductase-like aldo/keto reductase